MTRRSDTAVSDKQLGEFARRQNDWFRRVSAGSLDPDEVSKVIHLIIDRGSKNPIYTLEVLWPGDFWEGLSFGKFDEVDEYVTKENFPFDYRGKDFSGADWIGLFCFKEIWPWATEMSDVMVRNNMKVFGYAPGRVEHLMAVARAMPELQKTVDITAIGSVWHYVSDISGLSKSFHPILTSRGKERILGKVDCKDAFSRCMWYVGLLDVEQKTA